MINCELIPLDTEQQNDVARYLADARMITVLRIIESKVKAHEAAALVECVEAGEFDPKLASASVSMQLARKYASAVQVLKELREDVTALTIAKLT